MPRSIQLQHPCHTAKTLTSASPEVYRQSVTVLRVALSHNTLKPVLTFMVFW